MSIRRSTPFAFALILAALSLSASLSALPRAAVAQDDAPWTPPPAEPEIQDQPPADAPQDGFSLIERGAGMLLREMLSEVEPELNQMGRDFSDSVRQFAPVMKDLAAQVDDLRNYEPPERLANGDILIRRKPGAPPPPAFNGQPGDDGRDIPGLPLPLDPNAPEIEL